MINNSKVIIINAARHAFTKHGYKRANMSLISEYSGYSRVTVHKYLANKEDAFRQSILQIIEDSQIACSHILKAYHQGLPCWDTIESLIEEWGKPSFKEVTDPLILYELKYYGQEISPDLFKEAYSRIDALLETVLTDSNNKGLINLSRLNLTAKQVAQLIVSSMSGFRSRGDIAGSEESRQNLIKVFKTATES